MASDLEAFGDPGFDPVAWINSACENRPTDEVLDKYLAELEMRLQLSAEELEASLGDVSGQAMRRIPFAIQEIYRLQGDIQGMQDQVQVMAQTVSRDAGEARGSVQHIAQLHRVKANMESACSSLKEATELSGLFVRVEEVFAAGDLPKVADILASMRRSLSLVGDVPEFRAGRQKLRSLEDRLQTQVEGSLGDALSRGLDDDNTRKLCGLLLAVDRFGTIEGLYVNTKLAQVHALWEEAAAAGATAAPAAPGAGPADAPAGWFPRFLQRLLQLLEAEAGWAGRVLPGHAAELLRALCVAVFSKISKAARERLAAVRSLGPLSAMAAELGGCGRELCDLMRGLGVEHEARREVLTLLYTPLEDKVAAYGELEAARLAADLKAALPAPAAPSPQGPGAAGAAAAEETEAAVLRLAASVKPSFAALQGSVERCNALTGGSEVRQLLKAVDGELSAHLGRMTALVAGLGARRKAAAGEVEDGEEIAHVLQLIKVGREASSLVGRLEAALRTAVAAAVGRLQALVSGSADGAAAGGAVGSASPFSSMAGAAPGSAAPSLSPAAEADPVALRLLAAPAGGARGGAAGGRGGDRLSKLAQLGGSLSDPRFLVLPASVNALDAFASSVQGTVFDVLLARVASLLAPLPGLAEWRKAGPDGAAAPLPTFNTYPLPYVTAIGDHLMAMPQQLEVLMDNTEESSALAAAASDPGDGAAASAAATSAAEWEEVAAEWLDKAVTGAAAMYADVLFKIPELGQQGGCQLAADVEYFVNVMGALHVAPPAGLLTVQLLAGAAPEEFAELARGALAEGAADAAALRALAGMRRIVVEGA